MNPTSAFVFLTVIVFAGCERQETPKIEAQEHAVAQEEATPARVAAAPVPEQPPEPVPQGVSRAVAVLHPTEGNQLSGSVTFTRQGDRIEISGKVTGSTPGKHGFHVHEWGNCDCPDGQCAGAHFDVEGSPHAGPDEEKRHVGDLGNVEVGEDGAGEIQQEDGVIAFEGPRSVIGRAVVIHAGEDDLTSQPAGDAGARIACGVIGIAAF